MMQSPDLSTIRELICTTAVRAGQAALAVQQTTHAVKDDGTGGGITTQADLDAQHIAIADLSTYPGIPIVAEEGNTLTVCPDEAFMLDPVDGSAPYNAGAPDWTTTIGYRGPAGALGVIYQPARNLLYVTGDEGVEVRDGSGAKLRTLAPKPLPKFWRICMPFARDFSAQVLREVFLPIIEDDRVRAPENLSCNTAHFLRLFEGWDEGVIMWAKTWDSAAAIPMARMLGILVTDFNGNEPDLSVVEPQRLVFARTLTVLDCIVSRTRKWPYDNEMRK